MMRFRPYAVRTHCAYGQRWAIQQGGSGGKVIGREWGLTERGAEEVCEALQAAYEAGAESKIDA